MNADRGSDQPSHCPGCDGTVDVGQMSGPGDPCPGLASTESAEEASDHIYYCRTCGKTRFVEWLHRDCPPDARDRGDGPYNTAGSHEDWDP